MTTMLDVKSLSKVEKLRLLETLWTDLSSDEASVTSPAWHETALNEARQLHAEGKGVLFRLVGGKGTTSRISLVRIRILDLRRDREWITRQLTGE